MVDYLIIEWLIRLKSFELNQLNLTWSTFN